MDSEAAAGRGKVVLVAEDNDINVLFIESVLTDVGYRVLCASNGAQALAILESELPGIVLMDVQMPGMDGLECTRRIRSSLDPSRSALPIVALTGYAMDDDRRKCLEAGMDDFLTKPFDDIDLLRKIDQHYGKAHR